MNFYLFNRLYACHNTKNCADANAHKLVSASPGLVCSTCESPLQLAETTMNKTSLGLYSLFTFTVFYISFFWLFPSKLDGISFDQPTTNIEEDSAMVSIKIVLVSPVDEPMSIQYQTKAGTATADIDYASQSNALTIEPGQQEAVITIPVIPDRDSQEADEVFYVELTNVENQPTHTVVIREKGVNKDLLAKSDLITATLSGLAADIANDIATIKMLEGYLTKSLNPAKEISDRYQTAKQNIVNARERYLLLFNDAYQLDPTAIKASVDNRIAVLDREGFSHQLTATKIMKKQLFQFLDDRIPVVDRWMQELAESVDLTEEASQALLSI